MLDDTMSVIGIVYLKLKGPLLSIASTMDSGVLEYIDAFNSKFPFPIMGYS